MKTVILAGGLGTRLREETEHRPKPMVEIGGRPILWHLMRHYAHHGFNEFIVCLGYRGTMIRDYFLNYEAMSRDFTIRVGGERVVEFHDHQQETEFVVTLAETGADTNTGGRLKRVQKYVGGQRFMLTYGDGLGDVDLGALARFHAAHGRTATVTSVRPLSRFGVMDVGPGGEVQRFLEKPQLEGWISAGFFVLEPAIFDLLDGDETILEQEPLQRLAAAQQLRTWQHPGSFHTMDTYRDYLHLNSMWASGQAPWKTWP